MAGRSHMYRIALQSLIIVTSMFCTGNVLANDILDKLCPSASLAANRKDESGTIVVFVAKKIITMDQSWPTGTAVAVRDSKVLSVGTEEDMKPWLQNGNCRVERQ